MSRLNRSLIGAAVALLLVGVGFAAQHEPPPDPNAPGVSMGIGVVSALVYHVEPLDCRPTHCATSNAGILASVVAANGRHVLLWCDGAEWVALSSFDLVPVCPPGPILLEGEGG